jgi:hypothetical protein
MPTRPRGVTIHPINIDIFTAVRTSDLKYSLFSLEKNNWQTFTTNFSQLIKSFLESAGLDCKSNFVPSLDYFVFLSGTTATFAVAYSRLCTTLEEVKLCLKLQEDD